MNILTLEANRRAAMNKSQKVGKKIKGWKMHNKKLQKRWESFPRAHQHHLHFVVCLLKKRDTLRRNLIEASQ
jgi:hypothetical protein